MRYINSLQTTYLLTHLLMYISVHSSLYESPMEKDQGQTVVTLKGVGVCPFTSSRLPVKVSSTLIGLTASDGNHIRVKKFKSSQLRKRGENITSKIEGFLT